MTLTPATGSSGRGGLDKIEDFFISMQKSLALRGWLVWHAHTLTAMLDGEEGIRTRYAAWITEGDVLSAALERLRGPALKSVVPLAIKRDLRKDRDVRRKDAGQITEKRIFLEDVFVDLPLEDPASNSEAGWHFDHDETLAIADDDDALEEDNFGDNKDQPELGVVARLLLRSADKLDAETLKVQTEKRRRVHGPTRNRIVLLGGPGQGKSTVGQFLAQIARAKISISALRARPADESSEAAEVILSRARAEGLDIDVPPRFPLHIELPKFADALKQYTDRQDRLSILRYATQHLSRGSDQNLEPSDLRGWLGAYPWLLILDGLDEVPPSGNRTDVIQAINEFWDDVNEVNGDVMVIVTTRPQGYGDDLPRRHWEHWTMAVLTPPHAMRFAGRLSQVLLSDGSRRDEILAELKRASEDSATAPIMISPLQVSILFTLVETRGGVPADRWSLFQRHYLLLRDREAAKEGSTARLLRDYGSQIDQVHYDAGFLLHVRAEAAGSADAYLDEDEFEALIHKQLNSEGYSEDNIVKVKRELRRIATDRLVLLGSKVGGRISFDVRSLQEFMAAARIMSSPEQCIEDRLREIAGRTHWRHVFRIAASKAFALTELSHFRRHIIHVCDALDKGDLGEGDKAIQSGAHLALDLLMDNIAARLPEMRRALATRALEVFHSTPPAFKVSLAPFLDEDTKQTFESNILGILSRPDDLGTISVWRFLIQVMNTRPPYKIWAEDILLDAWPSDPVIALEMVRSVEPPNDSERFIVRLNETQLSAGPIIAVEHLQELSPFDVEIPKLTPISNYLQFFMDGPEILSKTATIKDSAGIRLGRIRFRRLFADLPAVPPPELIAAKSWNVVRILDQFVRTPNKETLGSLLKEWDSEAAKGLERLSLPWVIDTLLKEQIPRDNVLELIKEGKYGDAADWKAAEERWIADGITIDDLSSWTRGAFANISKIGAPFPYWQTLRGAERNARQALEFFLNILDGEMSPRKAKQVLRMASSIASLRSIGGDLLQRFANQLLKLHSSGVLNDRDLLRFGRDIPLQDQKYSAFLAILDAIGRKHGLALLVGPFPISRKIVLESYTQDRALRGFLSFILIRRGPQSNRPSNIIDDLPAEAFETTSDDTDATKRVIEVLRMMSGRYNHLVPEELASMVSECAQSRLPQVLTLICNSKNVPESTSVGLLISFCERYRRTNNPQLGRVSRLLKAKLDARESRLSDATVCAVLALPAPLESQIH